MCGGAPQAAEREREGGAAAAKREWERGAGGRRSGCHGQGKVRPISGTGPGLRAIMSPVEYFLTAYTIKSVLSVHALMVYKFIACLVQEENQYEVFDCFFEINVNTY